MTTIVSAEALDVEVSAEAIVVVVVSGRKRLEYLYSYSIVSFKTPNHTATSAVLLYAALVVSNAKAKRHSRSSITRKQYS